MPETIRSSRSEKMPPLIIGVLIVAVFFLFKGCDDVTTLSDLSDLIKGDGDSTTSTDEEEDTTEETTVAEEEKPEFNECGNENYGKPKNGVSCDTTQDCLNSPPEGYIGTVVVDIAYSDPILLCCLEDGTCDWQ